MFEIIRLVIILTILSMYYGYIPSKFHVARKFNSILLSDLENIDSSPVIVIDSTIKTSDTDTTTSIDPNAPTKSTVQSYIMCSNCKTSYLIDELNPLTRNSRVVCTVCNKDWFQTVDRIMKTDNLSELVTMSEVKVNEVKRILADRNTPKYPRVDKVGLFVGNLPYNYEEKDLVDLFSEYGLVGVALVRDPEGLSKGFGFIEVSNEKMAEKVLNEMHLFYTEPNRKLTVRLQVPKNSAERRPASAPPANGEKMWTSKKVENK